MAAARFAVTYAILFALELTVLPLLTGTWNFILGAAVGIYTHMLPGFIMGYYLVSTTTVSEFVAAMERMHVPEKIVIPVSVVFRFFPTVKEEYAAIRDAMKMRGITTLRSPMKMLEYRVVPLMMSIAKSEKNCLRRLSREGLERRRNGQIFAKLALGLWTFSSSCWRYRVGSVSLFVRRKESMIELRNINFRYAGGTDAGGLVNIDLIIPDGQVILCVGNLAAEKQP